jgi:hypothetical protein
MSFVYYRAGSISRLRTAQAREALSKIVRQAITITTIIAEEKLCFIENKSVLCINSAL